MNNADTTAYSILALDDHPMVLEGISHILANHTTTCITTTRQMEELLERGSTFDLFILDLELPHADGFEALKTIRQHCPAAAILIYTMHEEPWILARLARLDIQGMVSKALPVATLSVAVEAIRQGGTYFDQAFTRQQQLAKTQDKHTPGNPFALSEREQQVLDGIIQGLTTPEIAERLFISENTVGTYRSRLMAKFDAHNVAQLIAKAGKQIGLGQ